MSVPRADADCRICTYRRCCGKYVYNSYDVETGKPDVNCYGYEKEITEEDIKNSTLSKMEANMICSQCKGCCMLKDDKCTRVSNRNGEIGVCWMEHGEGEY